MGWHTGLKLPAWGMFCLLGWTFVLPGLCLGAAGNPWTLTIEPGHWNERLFIGDFLGRVTPSQAASFAYGNDKGVGNYVSVGPWHAGSYGARLEYRDAFPSPTGTLRGYYRTQGLLPYQVGVTIDYTQGRRSLAKRVYNLAPAPDWKRFEIPIRNPPEGADAFRVAVGLTDKTRGRVDFAQLTLGADVAELAFPAQPSPLTRPSPTPSLPASPNFRLLLTNGAFWFVTPNGRPFYSVGTVGPAGRETDAPRWSGPRWSAYLRDLGFNSLAGWTSLRYWAETNRALVASGSEPLPYFATLESASMKGGFEWLTDAKGGRGMAGHAFPDPFDPAFEAAYRTEVQAISRAIGSEKWFVAWFADNELDHSGLWRRVYSPHCARAFKDFLIDRYRDIHALNSAWQTSYASFDALVAARPDPIVPGGAMADDFQQFSRRIVDRFVDVTLKTIRSVDSKRPIFSNRFMFSGLGDTSTFLDLYARYDGIATNLYPQNLRPGLSENEIAYLHFLHERTGKPLLISEWSVPAMDSGLYAGSPASLDWSWNKVVATQSERAAQAAQVTVDFFNLPFVVGAHWFSLRDFRSDRYANRGLLTASGEPWPQLIAALRKAQLRLGQP